jgi:hypothetical protein
VASALDVTVHVLVNCILIVVQQLVKHLCGCLLMRLFKPFCFLDTLQQIVDLFVDLETRVRIAGFNQLLDAVATVSDKLVH